MLKSTLVSKSFLVSNGRSKMVKFATLFFLVLPFGLSSACYVFTKLLRPLVRKWRSQGFKSIIFVDDGITGHGNSFQKGLVESEVIKADLNSSGLVVNELKSDFVPKKQGKWLGTIIDTKRMTFTVPEEKIVKI